MLGALVFILGLIVGSFLNVVIYRTYRGIGFIKGSSYCPHCKHRLIFLDLFPLLSFIALRAKCRWCGKPISWQYPLVEFAAAMSFLFLYLNFGLTLAFATYALFTVFLIIIFVQDFRYSVILDQVSIPGIVVAIILSITVLHIPPLAMLIGMGGGAAFFLLQYLISRGKWIGGGDIRLGALMGAMLGWKFLVVALFLAYFAGSIVGIVLILTRKKGWKSHVPLGTFLTVTTFVTFFFGQSLIDWYSRGWFY